MEQMMGLRFKDRVRNPPRGRSLISHGLVKRWGDVEWDRGAQ